jgi:hypothetical protein
VISVARKLWLLSPVAYYPETNPLLPLSHRDTKSKTPGAKSIPVLVWPKRAP